MMIKGGKCLQDYFTKAPDLSRINFKHYLFLFDYTQKAQRTFRRVLEGTDVGVLLSYVVEETGEPGETTDLGRATTTLPHAGTGIRSCVAAVASECFNHCATKAPNLIVMVKLCHD